MSQRHHLEWSQAFIGRMEQKNTQDFSSKTQALATRLEQELNANTLPFLSMPYREQLDIDMAQIVPHLKKFEHMVVLGIGGSALGARAIQRAFASEQDGPCHNGPWLWIADNVCADTFESWLAKLPAEKTIVVCISKSGGTIETLAQYFLVRQWLQNHMPNSWTEHMILITDKNKGFLREQVQSNNLLSLEVPDFLGGRYSALSAVGMVPAAFLGINWQGLMDGAKHVAKPLVDNPHNLGQHPAYSLAKWCYTLEQNDYNQLILFTYIPKWATFGPWFAQLWAESLGKSGKGTMPIAATGVTDQHSIQQMFLDGPRDKGCIFLSADGLNQGRVFADDLPQEWQWLCGKPFGSLLDAEGLGTRMALTASQTPLVHMHMAQSDEHAAGALMLLLEACTIFTGWLMDINPVDQPAVELGKRLANARLGAPGYAKEEAELTSFLNIAQEIQEF